MKLNRDFTKYLNWVFDNVIPPVLRDCKCFMWLAFYPLFGKKTKHFMEFKEKAPFLSEEEIKYYYNFLSDKHIKRETDLNFKTINLISENISGDKILDIASGRGFLVNYLAKKYIQKTFYGIDIIVAENQVQLENTIFQTGNIEKINFPDNFFDTVICTHTLEHVSNINVAINELRRVCSKKLIIVVPRQREYKYTFDLHLHFFPYLFSLQNLLKNPDADYQVIDNDFVYIENISK